MWVDVWSGHTHAWMCGMRMVVHYRNNTCIQLFKLKYISTLDGSFMIYIYIVFNTSVICMFYNAETDN